MFKDAPDIGIIALAGTLASLFFAPEVATYVGPYMVILLASTIGASFSLARRVVDSTRNAVWFFVRTNGLAVLLTVALASIVNSYYPNMGEHRLIAPIAFVLGFVGDDWPLLLRWGAVKFNALVDILIKLRGGGNG